MSKQGKRLEQWRLSAGKSMAEAAFMLGTIMNQVVAAQSIHHWESGHCKPRKNVRAHIEAMTAGKVKENEWRK